MSSVISVQLDEVSDLAGELAALSAELDERARLCRDAATMLVDALGGTEGWRAGATATAWSSLVGLVAERTGAAAASLLAAVATYRAVDAAVADRMCPADPQYTAPVS
jgi:hypothetical protein